MIVAGGDDEGGGTVGEAGGIDGADVFLGPHSFCQRGLLKSVHFSLSPRPSP